MSTLIFLLIQG